MPHRIKYILLALILFFPLDSFFARQAQTNPELDPVLIKSNLDKSIGKQAPSISFHLIDTKNQDSLAHYNGSTVLLLFWNKNCSGCIQEMPVVSKLQESYNDAGLRIIFLSSDNQDIQASFLNTINIGGIKGCITDEKLNTPYPRFVAPAAILVDAEGIIRDAWLGTLATDETEKRINLLLPQSLKKSGSSFVGYLIGGVSVIFLVIIFFAIRRMK